VFGSGQPVAGILRRQAAGDQEQTQGDEDELRLFHWV